MKSLNAKDKEKITMINVIATIELNEGCRGEFIAIFKANVPNVKAEDGCIAYCPCIDVDAGLAPVQPPVRDNAVIVVEAWESVEHLHAHLKAPHMLAYKEQVKDMVKSVEVQVNQPV